MSEEVGACWKEKRAFFLRKPSCQVGVVFSLHRESGTMGMHSP